MDADEKIEDIGFSVDYMDRSADPRKDFFRFANGRWVDTHPIPPDVPTIGAFVELYEETRLKLRAIVEDCASGKSGSDLNERLVGDFYSSAMNVDKIEELRFKPMEEAWSIVKSIDSREALVKAMPELNMRRVYPFFAFYVSPDSKRSSVYALYLFQGGLTLPDRDYYLKEGMSKMLEYYRQHIRKMLTLYGIADNVAGEWADTVIRIETKIAKASWPAEETIDDVKTYNQITTEELERRYPNLKLMENIKKFEVPQVPYFIVGQPDFFDFMNSMINDEDLEGMKIYMYWNVMHSYASLLHKEIDSENFDMFGRKLVGQKEQKVRWKRAVGMTSGYLGEALGSIYVKRHFDQESKRKAEELVADLIGTFRERIKALGWMTDKTKEKAIDKLDKMVVMVGYPKKFRDYSGLVIRPDDYAGNVKRTFLFEMLRDTRRVGQPVDKEEWAMSPQDINAYNSPSDNRIVFPAGILQPPFFDKNKDHAVNYGGIGGVIGHEMTHGFDNNGRKHDADGNLKDWWTEEDEKRFNELAEEVVKEYSSKEALPGVNINGKLTLGENLADLGGVNIAYDALKKRLKSDSVSDMLIDGFTQDQRFFISYAQVWRDVASEESIKLRIISDSHSPDRFRAMIPAMNNPAFDKAFPANEGEDKLNKKIGVW